jgi:hypothetical protein
LLLIAAEERTSLGDQHGREQTDAGDVAAGSVRLDARPRATGSNPKVDRPIDKPSEWE